MACLESLTNSTFVLNKIADLSRSVGGTNIVFIS